MTASVYGSRLQDGEARQRHTEGKEMHYVHRADSLGFKYLLRPLSERQMLSSSILLVTPMEAPIIQNRDSPEGTVIHLL